MEFPKVDTELCTSCEICIDLCPMDAIHMVNGFAHINIEECSNCRACIGDCPVEAIN